jgi:hypothetical protein
MARMTDVDRFLRELLRDANPEDALAALQETITSVIGTLPPSQQRDFARKLKRRIPEMLKRSERLAREREVFTDWERFRIGDADHYCPRHTKRH